MAPMVDPAQPGALRRRAGPHAVLQHVACGLSGCLVSPDPAGPRCTCGELVEEPGGQAGLLGHRHRHQEQVQEGHRGGGGRGSGEGVRREVFKGVRCDVSMAPYRATMATSLHYIPYFRS